MAKKEIQYKDKRGVSIKPWHLYTLVDEEGLSQFYVPCSRPAANKDIWYCLTLNRTSKGFTPEETGRLRLISPKEARSYLEVMLAELDRIPDLSSKEKEEQTTAYWKNIERMYSQRQPK